MINVVLKKGTDYRAFKELLDSSGYTYKQLGIGRIFNIDAAVDEFTLKDHSSVDSCEAEVIVNLEPQYETRTLSEIYHYFDASPNKVDSWGLARLCRRNNPFYTVKNGYDPNPTSADYVYTRTGAGVDCYLIDVGFHPQHPELAGRTTWVETGSQTDQDNEGGHVHGTAVASNMAGLNIGAAKDALIWFVKTPASWVSDTVLVDQYGAVLTHYLSRSDTNRPAVLNHSFAQTLESDVSSAAARAAVSDCIDAGIVITVCSGNFFHNLDVFYQAPGEYDPDIVLVGAHSATDAIYDYTRSNKRQGAATGDAVDIYAPGVAVSCAYGPTDYELFTGTSMAAPYTAGVIACMLEGYQRLTHREQVKSVIRKLIQNSTKNKLRYNPNAKGIVHNRILYLDPNVTIEEIPGLKKL